MSYSLAARTWFSRLSQSLARARCTAHRVDAGQPAAPRREGRPGHLQHVADWPARIFLNSLLERRFMEGKSNRNRVQGRQSAENRPCQFLRRLEQSPCSCFRVDHLSVTRFPVCSTSSAAHWTRICKRSENRRLRSRLRRGRRPAPKCACYSSHHLINTSSRAIARPTARDCGCRRSGSPSVRPSVRKETVAGRADELDKRHQLFAKPV